MAHDGEQETELPQEERRRVGCWILLGLLALVLAALVAAWFSRERIADNVIAGMLDDYGIAGSYEIESIGPQQEVLRNVVIGDPAQPDLTIERAIVTIEPRFGFPAIGEVRLVKPRLYGRYVDDQLSFGALDPLIFTGEEGPFEFPDMALAVEDGRALLESDNGPVGIKLEGSGNLRGGFAGELAATAPQIALSGCKAQGATLYGKIGIDAERPQFTGPLRFAGMECADSGLALGKGAVQLDLQGDRTLAGFDGTGQLRLAALAYGANRMESLGGDARLTWRDGGLTARYELTGEGIATAQAGVAQLGLDGSLRTRRNFASIEVDGTLRGDGIRPGPAFDAALADMAEASGDTLLGPVVSRIRRQLGREGRDSRLSADWTLRRNDGRTSLVIPSATLRGSSGSVLLSLSRFQLASGGAGEEGGVPRFSGNFATGGEGLPRMAGRMEQREGGGVILRANMAPYEAGDSRIAVPELTLLQRSDGALGFSGRVEASGALPGGHADGLVLPLSGNWSPARGLSLWRSCTNLRFKRLSLANLSLDGRELTLCPPRGGAIVKYGDAGLQIAAGAPSLELTGTLADTPLAIRSGAVGFGWPGNLTARELQVTLGPPGTETSFAVNELDAEIGDDIAGKFAGADVRLYSVPLDLLGASGSWRYADGRLMLTDGSLRVEDREEVDRFNPMVARDATLSLEDNRITAEALLREPKSDRAVAHVDIVHDLNTADGHADLAVDGLSFDDDLQPLDLTELAKGIVANVAGTVTGTGRIDWTADAVTSSGRFSSDSLDLAAAFGPVKGVSGTVEFSDLLGLTTAPHQTLHIDAINPGTEVYDGNVSFQLVGGELLEIEKGKWPFFGGTLTMRPVSLRFGVEEERRYVFEIVGLQAPLFIERMELDNLSATGVFDGTVPIVFDKMGNGSLDGGLLISRPPGGNISYVGELTYEDLSPMANFAFDALRSLDYGQMQVEMNGDLAGEIITRLVFDGVSQGEGAQKNFITRRIAKLPFRFDINVRASFYTLLNDLRSLYDPAAIDPRELNLLDAQGNPITDGEAAVRQSSAPTLDTRDEPPIQPSESEREP